MASAAAFSQPPQEIIEDESLGRRLDAMLLAVDARQGEPVGVAGPGSLDIMCALWRRGFERVEAARACTCGCADEVCALLIVSGHEASGIAATVEATGRLLKPGGRLAVLSLKGTEERQRLCNLLAHRGFRYRPGAAPSLIATKPDLD